jgi:hypothetical protein
LTDLLDFQAYLHVQLGFDAWDDARHDEAANHFTAAINTAVFSSEWVIQPKYEFFVEVRRCNGQENAFQSQLWAFLRSSGGT